MSETQHIDATELSTDEQVELAAEMMDSMKREAKLRHDAMLDRLDEDEIEDTIEWYGDSLAEAKGRAFNTRDTIENHTDRSVSVEHTGKTWNFPSTTYYEFRLIVDEA